MTDITELAQSLKSAAEKATPGKWERGDGKNGGELLVYCDDALGSAVCEATSEYNTIPKYQRIDNLDFIALANPANILALVEALEKAQQRIVELEDAEQKLCAANVTLDARAELAERQLAELESRAVKLPPELYTIGELIRTQDNRITDQPMFVVFQKREIIGSDEHSPSRICWVWDGEEVSELRAKRLEALYQDGRDTRGYDRYAMQEVDEFVTACFTEHGCKDYLRQNGHNLRLPYIYACGSFRNNEYQLVRNWLAGIKVEADSLDADGSNRNKPGMVVAVHIDVGDFVKFRGQVYEVKETDFDDHDVTLWFVCGEVLKCAAGCPIEVVSAPVENE